MTFDVSGATKNSAFVMWDGGDSDSTIEFGEGVTVTGWSSKTNNVSLVSVNQTSHFIIDGATIAGATKPLATTSGSGDVQMKSGTISDYAGDWPFKIYNTSTFTMSGGTISGSTAGVWLEHSAQGTFSGGTISGCTTNAAVYLQGASTVANLSGTNFTGNSRRTAYVNQGTVNFSAGTISNSTVNMTGGAFFLNGAATLTMSGTAAIDNVDTTGGVNGAAVYVGNSATFTMTGGSITNCDNPAGNGVIHVESGGTFTMTGGSITGNTALYGGAVDVRYTSCTFNFGGSAVIKDNTCTNNTSLVGDVHVSSNTPVFHLLTGDFTGEIWIYYANKGAGVVFGTAAEGATISGTIYGSKSGATRATITNDTDLQWLGEARIGSTYYDQLVGALGAVGAGQTITLCRDVDDWVGTTSNKHQDINRGVAFTLDGDGHTLKSRSGISTSTGMFVLYNNTQLTLTNITMDGANTRRLIDLGNAGGGPGTVILGDGAVLQNGINSSGTGGAVSLYANHANTVFRMLDGSTIRNCNVTANESKGGAVFLGQNSGTFDMQGGTIEDCYAKAYGGAVYVAAGSAFTMSGGTITGCESGSNSAAIHVQGGDVTLSGGTISGNTGKWCGVVGVIAGTLTLDGDVDISSNSTNNTGEVYLGGANMLTVADDFIGSVTVNYAASLSSDSHQFGLTDGNYTEIGQDTLICFNNNAKIPAVLNGALVWIDKTPAINVTTDAGVYQLSAQPGANYGVIRMFAELSADPALDVERFGIYVIQLSDFSGFEEGMAGLKHPYEYHPASAEALSSGDNISADLRKIPAANFEDDVVCICYIKLAGQSELLTKIVSGLDVVSAGVDPENVKDLGIDPELYPNQNA